MDGGIMKSQGIPFWVWVCLAGVVAFTFVPLSSRFRAEQSNRAVELSAEIDAIEQLAAGQQLSLDDALDRLKRSGLGAVVVSEETLDDVAKYSGDLRIESLPEGAGTRILATRAIADRLVKGLHIRIGEASVQVASLPDGATEVSVAGYHYATLRGVSLGLPPQWTSVIRSSGLRVIGRMSNPLGANPESVRGSIEWASGQGMAVFLPQGEQVLGRREGLDALIESLRSKGLLYASPEFVKIGGDSNVLREAPDIAVSLHSAQTAELDRMASSEIVERYVRAGRERNCRILLLRPATFSSEAPLEDFAKLAGGIRDGLIRSGAGVGPARPFAPVQTLPFLPALLCLLSAPVAFFAALAITENRSVASLLTVLLLISGAATLTGAFVSYAALALAVLFPVAAFVVCERLEAALPVRFLAVSGVSLIGGLCVAAVLTSPEYFVRGAVFSGVKLSLLGPIALVGAAAFVRYAGGWPSLKQPATWLQLSLGLLVLAAFGMLAIRTGNDNPSAVSDLELRFRAMLDALLYVRPRTKEFLIGHPMLVVSLGLMALHRSGNRKVGGWLALALALAWIGQTGIVNTLCHLHTPLSIGLTRVAVGLMTGGILGGALWLVARRALRPGGA